MTGAFLGLFICIGTTDETLFAFKNLPYGISVRAIENSNSKCFVFFFLILETHPVLSKDFKQ